ncbi:MAG: hypothetical protein JXA11_03670 [Phycisphaerae bacterium]|nr:hypothetical protein [Phycisphaerae bacterium]
MIMSSATPPRHFQNVYSPGIPINDHTFLRAEGNWHLFHIWMDRNGPRDNVIGHAVSENLRGWREQPDILPKTPAPSWEDHRGANAPYVLAWEGTYYLFYSRYHLADHGKYELQQIGLAKSPDLYHWEKYENNPVFHPASFWCPWEDEISDLFRPGCCRDPHVLRYGDKWILYYVANTRTDRISAVAHAVSDDLIHWEDKGPVLTLPVSDTGTTMCESPCVVHEKDRWHLFVKHGLSTHYAQSETPFAFPTPTPLCASHASEVFSREDQWFISHCDREGLWLARMDFSNHPPQILPLEE